MEEEEEEEGKGEGERGGSSFGANNIVQGSLNPHKLG